MKNTSEFDRITESLNKLTQTPATELADSINNAMFNSELYDQIGNAKYN